MFFDKILGVKKTIVIHFIGIGGNGMSGIAEILHFSGYKITGSDINFNNRIKYLLSLGIKIYLNHSKDNVLGAGLVIYSFAIDYKNNVELYYARYLNIPVLNRMELLFELSRFKYYISVVGSHGKTTTTAMIFDMLSNYGFKINCLNGGNIKSIDSYIYLCDSKYFLFELDESNSFFLLFRPVIVIITSISNDHLNNYGNKFENLVSSFSFFLKNVPFYGFIIACIDDLSIKTLLDNNNFNAKVITYGFSNDADIYVFDFYQKLEKSYFMLSIFGDKYFDFVVPMIGKHNILNAVASLSFSYVFKCISINSIKNSLSNFLGVSRRSEKIGNFTFKYKNIIISNILVMFDYGHHPIEISNSINSIGLSWNKRRIVMIFQPHRYTRTQSLFFDFLDVLSKIDILILLDIYSANECILNNDISSADLLCSMYDIGFFNVLLLNHEDIVSYLFYILLNNDIILFQGAGFLEKILLDFISKSL